jgi:hypothetical protein
MLLELWEQKSTRLIGYQPLDNNCNVVQNEFYHPQFMAGRIIYLSHLERILAITYNQESAVEAWVELLNLGFKSSSTNIGFKTLNGNKNKNGFPVLITTDVPEEYEGLEYYVLATDLMSLDIPSIPLGIYIENPLSYINVHSQGKVSKDRTKIIKNIKRYSMKIITSHKRKLVNIESLDKIEQGYTDNLKVLRDISYNDKVILDYVDFNKPHLPIFITNPPPNFIINDNCKILVLHHFSPKISGVRDFQKKLLEQRFANKLNIKHITKHISNPTKIRLVESQENFFLYINILKEKLKKSYTDSLKNLENKKLSKLYNQFEKGKKVTL